MLFVTIGDAVKIAHFSTFSKAIAFGFFYGKKSTVESVGVALRDDKRRREELFEPIPTKI